MAFTIVPGIKGRIFVPSGSTDFPKKNPCKNCYSCQMCGDDRCSVCLCQNAGIDEPVPDRKNYREGYGCRPDMLKTAK